MRSRSFDDSVGAENSKQRRYNNDKQEFLVHDLPLNRKICDLELDFREFECLIVTLHRPTSQPHTAMIDGLIHMVARPESRWRYLYEALLYPVDGFRIYVD